MMTKEQAYSDLAVPPGEFLEEVIADLGMTKGNARRLIQQGGAYVNQKRIDSIEAILEAGDFDGEEAMLRAGKKRYHRLQIKD